MNSYDKLTQRLQQQLLNLKANQSSQSHLPISNSARLLWQGQYLDGLLLVELAGKSQIFWYFTSDSHSLEGSATVLEFGPQERDLVEIILDRVREVYFEQLKKTIKDHAISIN